MKTNPKLKQKKRTKRKEAYLMSFKLLINNQGQFITELSKYPMDKIALHFKKQKDKDVNKSKLATKFMCEEIKET